MALCPLYVYLPNKLKITGFCSKHLLKYHAYNYYYSEIRCIALRVLQTLKKVQYFGFSVPSIILVRAGLMQITM